MNRKDGRIVAIIESILSMHGSTMAIVENTISIIVSVVAIVEPTISMLVSVVAKSFKSDARRHSGDFRR